MPAAPDAPRCIRRVPWLLAHLQQAQLPSGELGMPHLAGVGSATEVQQASQAGLYWLKAFPARELGASWISAMKGPFPSVRCVATGGIDGENAKEFLEAGAAAVSLGAVFAGMSEEQLASMRV